jgi:hypothetical protein
MQRICGQGMNFSWTKWALLDLQTDGRVVITILANFMTSASKLYHRSNNQHGMRQIFPLPTISHWRRKWYKNEPVHSKILCQGH